MVLILVLNTLAALASAGFAAAATLRPTALSRSSRATAAERFYAYMYSARATPFGLVAAALPWATRGVAVASLLFVAAAIQLLDVAIGIWHRETGQIGGGAVLTVIHTVAGFAVLWRAPRHPPVPVRNRRAIPADAASRISPTEPDGGDAATASHFSRLACLAGERSDLTPEPPAAMFTLAVS